MQRVNYSLSQRAPEYRLQTPRAKPRSRKSSRHHPKLQPHSDQQHTEKLVRSQLSALSQCLSQVCVGVSVLSHITHTWRRDFLPGIKHERAADWRSTPSADCGFARKPKCAAAGLFTQIDPIVCLLRKTHTDRVRYSNMCVSALCNCSQMVGASVCVCVCVRVCVLSLGLIQKAWEKPGKLCISKIVQRGSIYSLSSKETFEREHWGKLSKTFILFHQDNSCESCTINLYLSKEKKIQSLGFFL